MIQIFGLMALSHSFISQPLFFKSSGLFRTGMRQSSGYNQVKPIIEEKAPLLQIAFAADAIDITTYEEISKLIPIRKFRIINEKDLKKQEYYYEKMSTLSK